MNSIEFRCCFVAAAVAAFVLFDGDCEIELKKLLPQRQLESTQIRLGKINRKNPRTCTTTLESRVQSHKSPVDVCVCEFVESAKLDPLLRSRVWQDIQFRPFPYHPITSRICPWPRREQEIINK